MRPRDLVMSHLGAVGEVSDPGGRASAALAAAVGYPGSSAAFAQLLSGMERSGLIEREVRGKRTYRIASASREPQAPHASREDREPRQPRKPRETREPRETRAALARDHVPGPGAGSGIDYDKLARLLLAEAARRDHSDLVRTVASLERKLALVEARQRRLRAENARLRELLAEVRQSPPDPREPGSYPGRRADTAAVQLLERLLVSLRAEDSPGQSA